MTNYKLYIDANSKQLPEEVVDELLGMSGLQVYAKYGTGEALFPWDTDINIEGNKVVMTGYAGPEGLGSCIVSMPKADFNRYYELEYSHKDDSLANELLKYGWRSEKYD